MTRPISPADYGSLHVVSVRTGTPQSIAEPGGDTTGESSILKTRRAGAVHFGRDGVEGDRQADLQHHGGTDKAVCVYPLPHYTAWTRDLEAMGALGQVGAFGENLTVEGLVEADVSIGDHFEAPSGLVLQVTQPRVPCWKLASRWGVADMAERVMSTGRTGWYCRVLSPGSLQEGEDLMRTLRPHADWTVGRVNRVYQAVLEHPAEALSLAEVPPLSAATRASLYRRLEPAGYTPMACAVHDVLEDAAVRRVQLDLDLMLPDGASETHRALVRDLRTEEGAEYVELDSSRLVRLDRIARVAPVADRGV